MAERRRDDAADRRCAANAGGGRSVGGARRLDAPVGARVLAGPAGSEQGGVDRAARRRVRHRRRRACSGARSRPSRARGGDMLRTKSVAEPDAHDRAGRCPARSYLVTGDKHFGSGSGVTSFMVTTAVPAGEEAPTIFALDVRDRPWDGSAGMRLTAEWDGMGMAATQSHAMRLEACPATRMAWDGPVQDLASAAGPLIASLFTAVVLGVLDEAIATAKQQLEPKVEHAARLRAGRVVACGDGALARRAGVRGRAAGRGAATTGRCTRRCGRRRRSPSWPSRRCGASPGWSAAARSRGVRRSPRGSRTSGPSGFLRPPWGLAYDGLLATSFESS